MPVDTADGKKPCAEDAFALFQDLCVMTAGDPGTFLKKATIPRGFGFELIENFISGSHSAFLKVPFLFLVDS